MTRANVAAAMALATALALALALAPPASGGGAEDAPPRDRCSVALKCSSTGLDCGADDRACQDAARERGLEIVCDRPGGPGETAARRFVYCPPGAAARDSRIVWVLLTVAAVLALTGGAIAWVVIGKKTRGP